jgi:hypothetical protein
MKTIVYWVLRVIKLCFGKSQSSPVHATRDENVYPLF